MVLYSFLEKAHEAAFQILHYDGSMRTILYALTCDKYFANKHINSNRKSIFSTKISPSKYLSLAEFQQGRNWSQGNLTVEQMFTWGSESLIHDFGQKTAKSSTPPICALLYRGKTKFQIPTCPPDFGNALAWCGTATKQGLLQALLYQGGRCLMSQTPMYYPVSKQCKHTIKTN